jgi:hypothetical protein
MNARMHRPRFASLALTGLIVAAYVTTPASLAFCHEIRPAPSAGSETGSSTGRTEPPAGTPEGSAGMVIYIDPQTGALLNEPAPGSVPLQLTPRLRRALSRSQQGLVEVPSPLSGGGVKVDLQGRFASPHIATIDATGKVRIQDLPEAGTR